MHADTPLLTHHLAENAVKAREHAAHKAATAGPSDRKSRQKGSGAAKKHGGGGKWTWGSLMTDGGHG